ncbi:hypothetical protein LINGRAHAP2_LOCUS32553, partial [Linum grandiflorum]
MCSACVRLHNRFRVACWYLWRARNDGILSEVVSNSHTTVAQNLGLGTVVSGRDM